MTTPEFRPRRQLYAATSPWARDRGLPNHITLREAEEVVRHARQMGMTDHAKVAIDYDVRAMFDRLLITEDVE